MPSLGLLEMRYARSYANKARILISGGRFSVYGASVAFNQLFLFRPGVISGNNLPEINIIQVDKITKRIAIELNYALTYLIVYIFYLNYYTSFLSQSLVSKNHIRPWRLKIAIKASKFNLIRWICFFNDFCAKSCII